MEAGFVPYIPVAIYPFKPESSWRRWLFQEVHDSPIRGHRDVNRTLITLRRMAFWPSQARDAEFWCFSCETCNKIRGQPMPQLQCPGSEEGYKGSWLDIYVDFQGPFTESAEGYRYICTYTCKLLRVPLLVPCKTLLREEAMHDVGTALLRSLTIPSIICHDRGQEFGSAVLEEV